MDLGSPTEAKTEPMSGADHADLVIPFPIGAKTRPMTKSASKEGPSTQILASTKRPTKTPRRGSNSKRPKR